LIVATVLLSCTVTQARAQQLGPDPGSKTVEQLWADASAAQKSQQYLRAAAIYRDILAARPDFVEAEVNLGLMSQLSGSLPDAITSFEHVLIHHPGLFVPNLLAGMDYLKLDNPERAEPYLQKAVRLDPDKVEARMGLGNDYLQLKKYPEAIAQFNDATKLNSSNSEAWDGLGATYLSMEKEIETDLRHTSSPFRTVLLAQSYLQQGKTEKAVGTFEGAIASEPKVLCVHSMLGFALMQNSRDDDAAKQFERDWDSQSGGCLLAQLGVAALDAKRGRTENALNELKQTYDLEPAFVKTNADLFLNKFAAAGAEARVREILESPQSKEPVRISGESPAVSLKKGRYSVCTATLAARSSKLEAQELRTLSACAYYASRDDLVLRATEQLLRQFPGDPEALYWRIQSTEHLGIAALSRATEINPDSASLHALTGDLLYAKGDLNEAAAEYRKAIDIRPEFFAAHIGLARDLNSDHREDEAEREVQFVLNSNPLDPEANYLMGEILVNRSHLPEALPFLLHAQNASSEELPFVHADLSRVYEERGDDMQAIKELRQAISIDVDGSYHYRLGHLYMKVGDRVSAAEALKIAEKLRHQTDAASLFQK
jgi:tetratricopeptide (TPR) repeat protein